MRKIEAWIKQCDVSGPTVKFVAELEVVLRSPHPYSHSKCLAVKLIKGKYRQ